MNSARMPSMACPWRYRRVFRFCIFLPVSFATELTFSSVRNSRITKKVLRLFKIPVNSLLSW